MMKQIHLQTGRLAKTRIALASFALIASTTGVMSATATGNMSVQLTIQAVCTVDTVGAMNFGTVANLASIVTQSATIAISCTNTTPYTIELSAGGGAGATTSVRKMTFGGNTIDYSLYKDAGYTSVWGVGATDDVNSTGTGAQQTFTVYGRVPVQALPNPGTYTDTVTVTVTY